MSWLRIKAILLQEYYLIKHQLEIWFDLIFFTAVSVIIFGFIAVYLGGESAGVAVQYPLLGAVLWQVVYVAQYSISVGALWNIWSRNLVNFFISPISTLEYLTAHFISSFVKSLIVFLSLAVVALLAFDFNIFQMGTANIVLFLANFFVFSWALGLFILGMIFRFGTRIQSLAWGFVFLLQPFTAAFFPVSVMPKAMQVVSYALPPTFIFEAARNALESTAVNWQLIGIASAENVVLFALAVIFFTKFFKNSRDSGQFVRNES